MDSNNDLDTNAAVADAAAFAATLTEAMVSAAIEEQTDNHQQKQFNRQSLNTSNLGDNNDNSSFSTDDDTSTTTKEQIINDNFDMSKIVGQLCTLEGIIRKLLSSESRQNLSEVLQQKLDLMQQTVDGMPFESSITEQWREKLINLWDLFANPSVPVVMSSGDNAASSSSTGDKKSKRWKSKKKSSFNKKKSVSFASQQQQQQQEPTNETNSDQGIQASSVGDDNQSHNTTGADGTVASTSGFNSAVVNNSGTTQPLGNAQFTKAIETAGKMFYKHNNNTGNNNNQTPSTSSNQQAGDNVINDSNLEYVPPQPQQRRNSVRRGGGGGGTTRNNANVGVRPRARSPVYNHDANPYDGHSRSRSLGNMNPNSGNRGGGGGGRGGVGVGGNFRGGGGRGGGYGGAGGFVRVSSQQHRRNIGDVHGHGYARGDDRHRPYVGRNYPLNYHQFQGHSHNNQSYHHNHSNFPPHHQQQRQPQHRQPFNPFPPMTPERLAMYKAKADELSLMVKEKFEMISTLELPIGDGNDSQQVNAIDDDTLAVVGDKESESEENVAQHQHHRQPLHSGVELDRLIAQVDSNYWHKLLQIMHSVQVLLFEQDNEVIRRFNMWNKCFDFAINKLPEVLKRDFFDAYGTLRYTWRNFFSYVRDRYICSYGWEKKVLADEAAAAVVESITAQMTSPPQQNSTEDNDDGKDSEDSDVSTTPSANIIQQQQQYYPPVMSNNAISLRCNNCKFFGHVMADCFIRNIIYCGKCLNVGHIARHCNTWQDNQKKESNSSTGDDGDHQNQVVTSEASTDRNLQSSSTSGAIAIDDKNNTDTDDYELEISLSIDDENRSDDYDNDDDGSDDSDDDHGGQLDNVQQEISLSSSSSSSYQSSSSPPAAAQPPLPPPPAELLTSLSSSTVRNYGDGDGDAATQQQQQSSASSVSSSLQLPPPLSDQCLRKTAKRLGVTIEEARQQFQVYASLKGVLQEIEDDVGGSVDGDEGEGSSGCGDDNCVN